MQRTKAYISAALLSCLLLPVAAQISVRRDSLLRLARETASDTAQVWALMEAGKLYLNIAPDTAALYIGQALALARETGFERGVAKCNINISSAYNNLGRFKESVPLCQAAALLCERLGMKKELVAAYNNLGNAWDYMGNRYEAIEAFSKALRAMEGVPLPPHFPITVRNNIGRQYNDLRLYHKAFAYGKQSLEEASGLGDSTLIAFCLQIMVFPAIALGREAEAMQYCLRIERIARQEEVPTLLVVALNNMAHLVQDKRPEVAERYLREALAVSRQTGDLFGEIGQLQSLSRLYLGRKNYKAAETLAKDALTKAKQEKIDDEVADGYLILSDVALAQGRMVDYRSYRDIHATMRDTLANSSLIHITQNLETKYETEKKEQQINSLQQQTEIQQLRIRQKNNLIGGLALLSGLIALIGLLAARNLSHRRRLAEQEARIRQQQITQLEQAQQISVADALMRGQEDERSRLARDLHDGLGGMLSGVKQSLNGMKGNQILSDVAATALSQVISDLDRSIGELRHIARNMMPEALVRYGLKDALQDYCDHIRAAGGLEIHYQAFGLEKRLPQQTEVILFRIAQELLNNALKHAEAKRILVQLMENEGHVTLTVEDDGKGFDPEQLQRAPGVGWLNIRSRVHYLGGTLDLHAKPGQGASVSVSCLNAA